MDREKKVIDQMNIVMKKLFFTFCILSSMAVTAQNQIARRVFASAGKFTRSVSMPGYIYSLSYTVGEPIIFGANGTTNKLSNGFQQPDVAVNSGGVTPGGGGAVTAIGLNNNPFQVYPNPFSTFLNIKGPSFTESTTKLQLIDANGKLIQEAAMESDFFNMTIEEFLPVGSYFLNFYTPEGVFIQQTKLIKQNTLTDEK
jgi:hypothetical protein